MRRGLSVVCVLVLGAIGVVVCSVKQPTFSLPGAVRASGASLADAASPTALEAHVRELSEELRPRDHKHPENLDRVASYISNQLASVGADPREQVYADGVYRNVVGRLGPDSAERIVVGAHYDSAGDLPGADDNASGVAGLLELARLLAKEKLPMRVELVAYTLEEPPHFRTPMMGSAVHASSLKENRVQVRAMLSLEMLGYFKDEEGTQSYPSVALHALYPNVGNYIAVVGKFGDGGLARRVRDAMRVAHDLPVESMNAPRALPGVDFSDHLNYWDAGYPAVMITDTAFMRNPNYHRAADTAETLDYQRMAKVVQQVCGAVLMLAE